MQPADPARRFVIVGGGRWARVYLSVMAQTDFPWPVTVVSTHQASRLADVPPVAGAPVTVVPSIDALPPGPVLAGALVVNAAALHAETAQRLLERGAAVLIEKPAALRRADLDPLLALAAARGLPLVPALTFLHCSYLENMARQLRALRPARPMALRLHWQDPVAEQRYGEAKSHDPGTSIAQDVLPHVWAVLTTVLGLPPAEARWALHATSAIDGGRGVRFSAEVAGLPVQIELERDGPHRHRQLDIALSDETLLQLDFTREPGTLRRGDRSESADPDWDTAARPVRRVLQSFVQDLADPRGALRWQAVATGCTDLLESGDHAVKQAQQALLRSHPLTEDRPDLMLAFNELAAERLRAAGRPLPAGDRQAWQGQLARLRERARSQAGQPDWYSALAALDLSAP